MTRASSTRRCGLAAGRSLRGVLAASTLTCVAALIGVPSTGFAQWLNYPTAGVPRHGDGSPNLTAPVPKLPDGKPDFSGIWHTARIIPCRPEASRFIDCGTEIGGSPLALDLGQDMPGGLPYRPAAAD